MASPLVEFESQMVKILSIQPLLGRPPQYNNTTTTIIGKNFQEETTGYSYSEVGQSRTNPNSLQSIESIAETCDRCGVI